MGSIFSFDQYKKHTFIYWNIYLKANFTHWTFNSFPDLETGSFENASEFKENAPSYLIKISMK